MASPSPAQGLWVKLGFNAVLLAGAAWLAFPLHERITLGLDLQGGTHMVLEVDLDDAVRSAGERTLQSLRDELAAQGVTVAGASQEEPGRLVLGPIPGDSRDTAQVVLDSYRGSWESSWSGETLTVTMADGARQELRTGAALQVKETIGRRINEFGVREPVVTTGGDSNERIVLQLPGLDDVDRVRNIITRSSVMEFRLGRAEAPTREALVQALGGTAPDDVEIVQGDPAGKRGTTWYAVERHAPVRGEDLIDARQTVDEFGRPVIGFTFGSDGAKRFGEFTGRNVGKPMAIVLDGKVVEYATIREQIHASGVISGSYTVQEAQDAALTLRSGSLPARVSILFEQTVGPSLGRDSIAAGLRAALVGAIGVVFFMIVWYKGAGVNAIVALALNMVLIMAALHVMHATLTLPGIAGLVLTIGMGVDANVIIFERIKEELALGKSSPAAVEAGFSKAFWTILDSNITVFIAAVCLYNFGTGPIKGFAITLMLGLLAQMYTAIHVSHLLFELILRLRGRSAKLSIEWRPFRAPKLPFMRTRHAFAAVSGLLLAVGLGTWAVKGLAYGIDFQGGTQVVVRAKDDVDAEDLRQRLAGSEFAAVTIQRFGEETDKQFLLRLNQAETAVSTTTVNVGAGAGRSEQVHAAPRLVATLSGGETQPGKVDLNSAGRQTIREALAAGAGISADAASAAAEAIVGLRTRSGGLLASLDDLRALPDLPQAAVAWIAENADFGPFAAISSESVGPAVGRELKGQALNAVIFSLVGILIYVTVRFEFRFAVAAIVASLHDILVTVGIVALTGKDVDITVIAGLLTIVGFSLNDTIVVFDRIRENGKVMRGRPLIEILDASVNQTLSRTTLTSGATLMACLSLLWLGGPVLNAFSFTMVVGVVVGTYSSIFIASPIVLLWDQVRQRRIRREATA